MRISRSLALLVTGVVLVSGCGVSAEDYHRDLDAACAAAMRFNRSLPARAEKEDLSNAEVAKLAKAFSKKNLQRVDGIDAPGDLDDAQDRLVKVLRSGLDSPPTTLDAARSYLRRLVSAYDATGAPGCTKGAKASLKQFEDQADSLPQGAGS